MENKKRLEFIDALKGFAIFLVIWGHVIIQSRSHPSFVYSIIYSFHMPLFFMISGYFFKSSLKLNLKDFLFKKGYQLLYPWFLWCIILGVHPLVTHIFDDLSYDQIGIILFNRWFWFLRDLFLIYVITYLCYKIFKKGFLVAIFSMLIILVLPIPMTPSFFLPIFLTGILLKDIYSFILNNQTKILYISFFIFISCLFFWKDYYFSICPSLFSLKTFRYEIPNLYVSLYRWVVGISGSLFFFTLFQKTYQTNIFYTYFNQRGRYTLGIYILQTVIVEYLYPRLINFNIEQKWLFSLFIAPLLSIIAIELCYLIFKWVKKNKLFYTMLFGKHS